MAMDVTGEAITAGTEAFTAAIEVSTVVVPTEGIGAARTAVGRIEAVPRSVGEPIVRWASRRTWWRWPAIRCPAQARRCAAGLFAERNSVLSLCIQRQ